MLSARLISRSQWGARQPRSTPRTASLDKGQAIHWTWKPTAASLTNHWPDCYGAVTGVQSYHMNTKGWNDIAYNFVVCPHGFVFEGRGWDVRNGASGTAEANEFFLAMCFIMGEGDSMRDEYMWASQDLIEEALSRGHTNDQKPHSFFKSTTCPGPLLTSLTTGGFMYAEPNEVPPEPTGPTTPIMGPPSVTFEQALQMYDNRYAARSLYDRDTAKEIIRTEWQVSLEEGVDFGVAIGQVFKETGGFSYGGDVDASQWNFAGIGATGGVPGVTFPSIEAGVRAHIRRLRMYAEGTAALYDLGILYRPLDQEHWGAYPDTWTAGEVWARGTNYNESWMVDYIIPLRNVEVTVSTPEIITFSVPSSSDEVHLRIERR